MPRTLTPQRRVSSQDTRPRLPSAPGPKPAVISRADTLAELRAIYRLIDQELYAAAKSKLILLGRNLQH
jgi:hypothetical protein